MSPRLQALIIKAHTNQPTPDQTHEHLVNFSFNNLVIDVPSATKEGVEHAARVLLSERARG